MVVNSLTFLLFFVVVFAVYYLPISRKSHRIQNAWLLLASYFFYGWADWTMPFLLLGVTVVFYGLGLWLKAEIDQGHSKSASGITALGIVLGVGTLFYFKYLNFFAESFSFVLNAIGFDVSWTTLNIILPIGVSFFTFKLMSYIIEINLEIIEPSKDLIEFGTYIAFFPTIMSGPIDRPCRFIPQLQTSRLFKYDQAVDGCRQILWGMFTKMCIADNLAVITDGVWGNLEMRSPSVLLMAVFLFPIQLYADFDGYSNMAIGVGKLLGIKVTRNFNHPFLARNIAEFWKNWHMSLTGWLTDYVFMPLSNAFRGLGPWGVAFAVILNFVIVGLWHGANWTYVLFGLYHGLLFVPLVLPKNGLPTMPNALKIAATYTLVSFGLVLFNAPSLGSVNEFLSRLLSWSAFDVLTGFNEIRLMGLKIMAVPFIVLLLISEWMCRNKSYQLEIRSGSYLSSHKALRWSLYVGLIMLTLMCKGTETQFVYFQF